jgi:hypothetical protein
MTKPNVFLGTLTSPLLVTNPCTAA